MVRAFARGHRLGEVGRQPVETLGGGVGRETAGVSELEADDEQEPDSDGERRLPTTRLGEGERDHTGYIPGRVE